jgi:hypothetical protein
MLTITTLGAVGTYVKIAGATTTVNEKDLQLQITE